MYLGMDVFCAMYMGSRMCALAAALCMPHCICEYLYLPFQIDLQQKGQLVLCVFSMKHANVRPVSVSEVETSSLLSVVPSVGCCAQ